MSGSGVRAELVTFDVDELRCAIDAWPVVEIVRAVALRRIPGQPEFVAGVIDLRGAVVPVLDVRIRFGRPSKELILAHRFIVIKTRAHTVALWVDAIRDLVSLRAEDLARREGFVLGTRSFAGVARTPAGLIMIHDPDDFLSESESEALALLVAGT
jgi:purine-binding chemotaxis protein CheW